MFGKKKKKTIIVPQVQLFEAATIVQLQIDVNTWLRVHRERINPIKIFLTQSKGEGYIMNINYILHEEVD